MEKNLGFGADPAGFDRPSASEMELKGFEPLTSRLPAGRSSQLSYSPKDLSVGRKFTAADPIARRRSRSWDHDPAEAG